ncbi:MAG: calcium/sodium antiporter [Bacteroidales bacterium]|nr:calcium/sodium antiporter [Bacteroidales bacterium]
MVLQILLLLLGFVILIKGADWLVNGSVSLAKNYRISELAIGLTIVAFGTSAPELVVNIISSIKGFNDVTLGNVVGSNLFNLMFILGISGIVFPLTVQIKTIWNEIPFSLLAALILIFLANYTFNRQNVLSLNRADGFILIAFFILFMIYIITNLRTSKDVLDVGYKTFKPVFSSLLIIAGLTALVIGSRLVVNNAVKVAHEFGASEKLIGITIVSAGTSLPELVTSLVAVFRKNSDIAIGNVIGSNIFNIFFILGISSLISPVTYNKSFNTDILILIISTVLLFIFMFSGIRYKLDRWEAAILFIGYIVYILYLLM